MPQGAWGFSSSRDSSSAAARGPRLAGVGRGLQRGPWWCRRWWGCRRGASLHRGSILVGRAEAGECSSVGTQRWGWPWAILLHAGWDQWVQGQAPWDPCPALSPCKALLTQPPAAAHNAVGPGRRDRGTASLRDLCRVTQELETFPRTASASPPFAVPELGAGCPPGRASPESPQESPGCEKAAHGVPGTVTAPPSRQPCVTALTPTESRAVPGSAGLHSCLGGHGEIREDGDASQVCSQLLSPLTECPSRALSPLSLRNRSRREAGQPPPDQGDSRRLWKQASNQAPR